MASHTIPAQSRKLSRSIVAVVAGFFSVAIVSLATDQLFHALGVYPPWGEPMTEPGDNLLALAYRSVCAVAGSYLTARLAPNAPMRHAMILGFIGLVLSTIGAVVAINMDLGPAWYPVALVVTALPCAWLGGLLYRRRRGES